MVGGRIGEGRGGVTIGNHHYYMVSAMAIRFLFQHLQSVILITMDVFFPDVQILTGIQSTYM